MNKVLVGELYVNNLVRTCLTCELNLFRSIEKKFKVVFRSNSLVKLTNELKPILTSYSK